MSLNQNDYNKNGLVTFVLSMIASFAIMIYVAFFSGGIDLKEVKERAASDAAPKAEAENKPIDVSGVKDPWMSSEQMIARGKQVYSQNCAMCHGGEGKGDGPAGMALNPKPRNFVEGKWKKGGTRLGIYDVVANGLPPSSMQGYKKMLVKNDRWALVHFIHSITQNKVSDDDKEVASKAPGLE